MMLPEGETQALKVLIVEDEALVAMLIEDALADLGHQAVGIADTLAMALELADRYGPDLALCDVKLATGDCGVQIAEALAARGIACLFLSGNCPAGATSPLIVGCMDKPFRPTRLGEAVEAALAAAAGRTIGKLPPGMRLYPEAA